MGRPRDRIRGDAASIGPSYDRPAHSLQPHRRFPKEHIHAHQEQTHVHRFEPPRSARANPRHQPGFDESLERYDALRAEIAATAVAAPRRPPLAGRRRVVVISAAAAAAALALAGVLVGLTLSAASPQSAYAEARKAIAATVA